MIMGPVQPSYETTDIVTALTQSGDELNLKERYYPVSSLEEAFDMLEGFIIVPHEPKQSKMKKDKRKRNPLHLVPSDGPKDFE